MVKTVVIIPALNPLNSLIDYVKNIQKFDIEGVIIINDGSDEKYQVVFDELRKLDDCIVLDHEQNKGKGRALKTGFQYVIKNLTHVKSVLTVGAHGQHKLDDVQQILHNATIFSDGIILGVRNFHSKDVPLSSSIGNRAASMLFSLLFHKRLLDTQTGLRYITKQQLYWLVKVPGESFSYDTNMLVEAIKRNIPIYEIPIGHIKLKKNSIMFYDEIANTHKLLQQMLITYSKNRKHHG